MLNDWMNHTEVYVSASATFQYDIMHLLYNTYNKFKWEIHIHYGYQRDRRSGRYYYYYYLYHIILWLQIETSLSVFFFIIWLDPPIKFD